MRKTLRNLTVVVGGACLVAAGCSSNDSASKDRTVGFSHPATQVPYVTAQQAQVTLLGKEAGLQVLTDNSQLKLEKQFNSVQSWVTQGIAAINVLPIDPGSFAPLQSQAQAKGICWTTYGAEMEGSDGFVGLDPAQSGTMVADRTIEWITANAPQTEVLVLTNSADRNFAPRTGIPIESIKANTKANIVAVQDAVDQASGLTVTESVLKAHPNVRVVVAFNDDGALGAAQAMRNAGIDPKSVFVIGQDGSEQGLEVLKDPNSYLKASAALPVVEVSKAVVDVMANCMDGKEPMTVTVQPRLVEAGNATAIDELMKGFR
ncbi:sugar ABC transporter substrate-binding protein [Rhodococcus sp. NPDC055024]